MAQRTTKSQVSGYRFLLRRLEHALVRRDVRMIHDPMGAHVKAIIVGTVLMLLVLGGAVAFSIFKPQGSVGDSKILISKQSGQLYVLIDDQLRPVLNLASARLAVGDSAAPNSVSDSVLAGYRRGPQIGIPGAPSNLAARTAPGLSEWSLCDRLDEPRDTRARPTVGVVAGAPADDGARALGADDALFVRNGDAYFLIYRNTRAAIDPSDSIVRQTLGLQDATPRSASAALLDAIPPSRAITEPTISGFGGASQFGLNGARIGSIVSVSSLDATQGQDQLFVVLSDGVQQISPLVGDLIRAKENISAQPIEVSQGQIAGVPRVQDLPVDGFPETAPRIVDGTSTTTLCFRWARDGDEKARLATTLDGDFPVSDPKRMVPTVGASTSGVSADLAYIPPGRGYYVRSTGVEPDSSRSGTDFFISDTGVRYGVPAGSAQPLGLSDPLPAPYAIIGLLPPGPALAKSSALIERDDVAPTGS
ncbi:type VII secretion protein EccB [Williamsia sp. SKLECPSW1]